MVRRDILSDVPVKTSTGEDLELPNSAPAIPKLPYPIQKAPCQHSSLALQCPPSFALDSVTQTPSSPQSLSRGMPQAPKGNARESKEAQKAIEKEQKRNRGVMSCAECRRLKLKCDKAVPCSSCKRRGCSAICPNGKLTTGQGTRFVLADTEKLHEKIFIMSDRIRQLEDALVVLQSSVAPSEPHPLLRRDLLDVKSIIDLHVAIDEDKTRKNTEHADDDSEYIEAFGTLALRDDGAATFYGRSAGSESLLIGEPRESAANLSAPSSSKDPISSDLPGPIKHLSKTFPLAPVFTDAVDLDYLIQNHLPPWQRARQLCELYLSQAPWFFGAVTEKQLLEECLPLWYSEASDLLPSGSVAPLTQPNSSGELTQSQGKTSHDLALLFVVFCFGALTDNSLPPAPDNEEANMYCYLTRAALNLEPVLDRPPSVTTIQALALLSIYQGLVSGENSIECTWGIFGLATKLAQSIGLHRDCARWQLPASEVQKRRALFWELFITDGWQSLATGRLATFYLPFVDCELPNDPDPTIDDDGSVLPSFPAWKARFGYECVSAVIQNAQIAKVPKYSTIIELDRKVRDMELPEYAQRAPPENAGLAEAMKYYMPLNYRNFVLVYIHRCFFAEAVVNNPTDPMQSPYAPSFLAGYRSACELLSNLRVQFDLFPAQVARFWVLWTHAFSSSVMLASVVTHASGVGTRSKTTSAAMTELRRAVDLFKEASTYGGRAVKFLPILQRLLQKAEQAYNTAKPAVVRKRDIFSPSTEPKPKDELSIFSGRINTVTTKASSSFVRNAGSGARNPPGIKPDLSQQPAPSMPVTSNNPPMSSFTTLHPTLRDQWTNFEGDLNMQLTDAQRDELYTETDAHMSSLEESCAPDVPSPSQQPDVQETKRHQLHPLAIPSDFQSSAPYTNSSSAAPTYESNQEGVQYPSVSPQAHLQHTPPYHHYQPEVLQSASSQSSSQGYQYHSIDARYDPYGQPTYQHQHQPQDQGEQFYQAQQHHYHADTSHSYSSTASSQYAPPMPMSHYQAPSAQLHWDDIRRTYSGPMTHSHPLDSYSHYGGVAEEPIQQEQLHLQETWQSFGVYVGSPRPTP